MHPLSPHAPIRTVGKTAGVPAGRFGRPTAAGRSAGTTSTTSRRSVTPSPLDALAKEIHGKIVAGSPAAKAHVAADELTLRRPRRAAARRASFRTPPASR